MNRTERLYALVDELRATAPRPRTVGWLADRFGVSRRTIQRDLQALMEARVPVRAEAGPRGGWFIDRDTALPPINLTAAEALAVARRRVVWIRYADSAGRESEREVEPGGLLTASGSWYLIGWCRSRRAGRGFRLERILAAELRDEPCPARTVPSLDHTLAERVRQAETLRTLSRGTTPS
ncbi:WYL domain-containing protein [Nonomuraea sp. NPDC048901]|uniref:helix-turn-helix transcriptional regulator n=1 Tax=Nonomuraea sp. NPDC048901 TaxID=3155627 RepID=UPI0034061B76